MYILIGKSQLCCDSENKLLLGDHYLFLIENTASIYQLQDFVSVGYRFLTMQETLAYMHYDLASPGTVLADAHAVYAIATDLDGITLMIASNLFLK